MSKIFFLLFLFLFNSIKSNEYFLDEISAEECNNKNNNCGEVKINYVNKNEESPFKCCEVSYKFEGQTKNYCVVINNKFGNYFKNYKKSLKKKFSKVKIKCKANNIKTKKLFLFGFLILIF